MSSKNSRRLGASLAAALVMSAGAFLAPGGARAQTLPGHILGVTGGAPGGLNAFNTDGSNYINLTANTFDHGAPFPPGQGQNTSTHPSQSRDGGKIAFMSNRDGTGYRIFVMNGDGSGLRQLTFSPGPLPNNGTVPQDLYPVLSPDGGRIAFVANRSEAAVFSSPTTFADFLDIYVINTDGTGLHQVTFPQPNQGGGGAGSFVVAVVWSPDGNTLAFRGVRLATVGDPPRTGYHSVLGLVSPAGGGESAFAILDSTGQAAGLDWSPNGRYLVVDYGGEAQGAAPRRIILYDLQNGGASQLFDDQIGLSEGGQGSLRFSPESQRLLYLKPNPPAFDADFPTIMNLDGSGQSVLPVRLGRGHPLWWQPGAAIPTPARLELTPNPVAVFTGGPAVPVTPTLYDADNNVIFHGVARWEIDPFNGGSPAVSVTGQVLALPSTATATFTLRAQNGGLTGSTTVLVNPPGAVDVSAQVQITRSGFRFNRATGRYLQTVTLQNTGGSVLVGPISLALGSLPSGVTLANATGSTVAAPPAGRPYKDVAPGNLAPGAGASAVLEFSNPGSIGITYGAQALAGPGSR